MADQWFTKMNTNIKKKTQTEVDHEDEFEFQEAELYDIEVMKQSEVVPKKMNINCKKRPVFPSSCPSSPLHAAWHLHFCSSPIVKHTRSKSWGNEIRKCRDPIQSSGPVKVPDWSQIYKTEKKQGFVEDDYDADDEMIPPHELLAQRVARLRIKTVVSYSMVEGIGRTLKGRDLINVRNAIFIRTGYMD